MTIEPNARVVLSGAAFKKALGELIGRGGVVPDNSRVVIYGIKPEGGDLQWYRHNGFTDGTNRWTAGAGGATVSSGWDIYSTVLAAGDGVIYGIKPNGDLQWYRHDGFTDGTNRWTAGAGGLNVSGGWNIYSTVLAAGDGVIYGIKPNGDLQWYRHDGFTDGTNRWTAGAGGLNIGGGWDIYSTVLAAGNGVIYGIKPNGDLQWYRHDGFTDGTNRWTAGAGGLNIGGGWDIYSTVLAAGNGVIYGIKPNGDLQWYRHDGFTDGTNRWTAGAGGLNVSGGWNIYNTVLAVKPSATPRSGKAGKNGVIRYRSIRFDKAGNRSVHRGQVPVGSDGAVPVGGLNFKGDSFIYEYSFVDERGVLRLRSGEVTVTAEGRVQVGTVKLGGSFDGKKLKAQGFAEAVTVSVEASAAFETPIGSAGGSGHAQGPAAGGSAIISPDEVGGTVGASAGEIGGKVQITIGGRSFGAGGEIGLKAEVGLHWGPTSTIKLPLITISGPNPMAGATSFAINAVNDIVRDPVRAAETAVNDILGVGGDAVEAVGQVIEDIAGAVPDLFGSDDDDSNIVTTDQFGGPRVPLTPGAVLFD